MLEEARRVTGINAKTALIRHGLAELIACVLAVLGGSSPRLRPIPRRRTHRSDGHSLTGL